MTIHRHKPSHRYSEAVVFQNIIYLSGQVPDKTVEAGIQEQTQEVLDQIDQVLTELHSDKTKILDATVFLKDLADYSGFNEVWDRWVAEGNAPSRATVEAKLAHPEWKIEIKIIASC